MSDRLRIEPLGGFRAALSPQAGEGTIGHQQCEKAGETDKISQY
jgi:hypothetical protein